MKEIPTWWLILSGLFFAANLFLFVALGIAALKLAKVAQDVLPRIAAIEANIQAVVKKVDDLATHVKELVDNVGGRAKGVVGSAETVAQSASRQFERFSPFVVGTLTAIRLVKALSEMKKGRSAGKATSRGGLLRKKKPGLLGRVLGR